jgi:methionyl-tRNA formyltransferase
MSFFAITSNHPRHVRFLETLYQWVESPVVIVVDKDSVSPKEVNYFDSDLSLLDRDNIVRCSKEQLYSDFVLDTLAEINPKVGFVFGAPLLKKEIFSLPEYGCVNIHTGLVDHYRGVDSILWALYDNRPDLVGATLHHIDNTIDAGLVIDTRAVSIELNDSLDTLFYKSCIAGFELLSENIEVIIANKPKKTKLLTKGVLYQNKDRNTQVIEKAKENLRRYQNENYSRSL